MKVVNKCIRRLVLCCGILFFNPMSGYADIRTGLVGWWRLNESLGTTAADSSGNGNTGILVNSPRWTTGKIGNAVTTTNGYVNCGTGSSLDLANGSAVSMCAWVNPSSFPGGFEGIMAKRTGSYAYGINFNGGNFQVYTSGGSGIQIFSYTLPLGVWTHICGIMSSSPTELYVNGALNATLGSGGGVQSNSSDPFVIGQSGTVAEIFVGSIDDVRIYNRVLTAGDVAQLYKTGPRNLRNAHLINLKGME